MTDNHGKAHEVEMKNKLLSVLYFDPQKGLSHEVAMIAALLEWHDKKIATAESLGLA